MPICTAVCPICTLLYLALPKAGPLCVLIVKKPTPAATAQLLEMGAWLQQQGLQARSCVLPLHPARCWYQAHTDNYLHEICCQPSVQSLSCGAATSAGWWVAC